MRIRPRDLAAASEVPKELVRIRVLCSICIATLGRYPSHGALRGKLEEFYTAKTAFELNCMLGHSGRYAAYDFDNLSRFLSATDEDKARRRWYSETFEFSQHEATLHGNRAKYWAMFCVGLVEWAMRTPIEEMKTFLVAEMEMQKREQRCIFGSCANTLASTPWPTASNSSSLRSIH